MGRIDRDYDAWNLGLYRRVTKFFLGVLCVYRLFGYQIAEASVDLIGLL